MTEDDWRLQEASCRVPLGLGSFTEYEARARERCSDPVLDAGAGWAYLGATRTLAPVRADAPMNLQVSLLSPFRLSVTWQAGVSAGQCAFDGWRVEVSASAAPSWRTVPECELLAQRDGTVECMADMLLFSAAGGYDVRVYERCTDVLAWSAAAALPGAVTLAAAPGLPTDVELEDAGDHLLSMRWTPSASSCPDVQRRWRVYLTPTGGSAISHECSASLCTVSGLARNTAYAVAVSQACSQPVSLSSSQGAAALPLWTKPGEWDRPIGTSEVISVTVDTVDTPYRCYVAKSCCSDEFFVCPSRSDPTSVEVTRADVPGGWGQLISLRCVSPSLAQLAVPFFPYDQAVPAPGVVVLLNPTINTLEVLLPEVLGRGLRDCECAEARLEITVEGQDFWANPPRGSCTGYYCIIILYYCYYYTVIVIYIIMCTIIISINHFDYNNILYKQYYVIQSIQGALDWSVRRCTITRLPQGTRYLARLQIICPSAAILSSPFTQSEFAAIALRMTRNVPRRCVSIA